MIDSGIRWREAAENRARFVFSGMVIKAETKRRRRSIGKIYKLYTMLI
jgi:hypothetical protein